jgi:hypothetical protein
MSIGFVYVGKFVFCLATKLPESKKTFGKLLPVEYGGYFLQYSLLKPQINIIGFCNFVEAFYFEEGFPEEF